MTTTMIDRRMLIGGGFGALMVAGCATRGFAAALAPGRWPVDMIDAIPLVDKTGSGRTVLTRIYVPRGATNAPVLIFSHGFLGDMSAFEATCRYWASFGYAIALPTHKDSLKYGEGAGDARLNEGFRAMFRKPIEFSKIGLIRESLSKLGSVIENPAIMNGRIRDVRFLIEAVKLPASINPAFKAAADTKRIGIAGHSMGAATAQVAGGSKMSGAVGALGDLSIPELRSVLTVSPQGPGRTGFTERSWDGFKKPWMIATGSLDKGANNETPDWRMKPFELCPPGDKYLLFLEGINHLSFDGKPGALSDPTQFLKTGGLAFLDLYLRGDPSARARLDPAAFNKAGGGVATLKVR
jgi:predicted dienelactone hydrolase